MNFIAAPIPTSDYSRLARKRATIAKRYRPFHRETCTKGLVPTEMVAARRQRRMVLSIFPAVLSAFYILNADCALPCVRKLLERLITVTPHILLKSAKSFREISHPGFMWIASKGGTFGISQTVVDC